MPVTRQGPQLSQPQEAAFTFSSPKGPEPVITEGQLQISRLPQQPGATQRSPVAVFCKLLSKQREPLIVVTLGQCLLLPGFGQVHLKWSSSTRNDADGLTAPQTILI